MSTPSNSGQWQNQNYPVNAQSTLYAAVNLHAPGGTPGTTVQPATAPGVVATPLGGSGAFAAFNVVSIAQFAGYELFISMAANNGTQTGMLATVQLLWFDNLADAIPIDHIRMDLPAGSTANINTSGKGPQRGQWLMVLIANQTPTFTINLSMSLTGTLRTYSSDDWRSDGGLTNFTNTSVTQWTNELCMVEGASIPASAVSSLNVLFYSGQAYMHFDASATGTLTATLQTWDNKLVATTHPGQNNGSDILMIMPRVACWLQISNSSGSASGIANFSLLADRL